MNVYTSDGLLVQQIPSGDAPTLATGQGQQLISIYRLFLQLHHAGSGAMRIKDMLRPDATDSAAGETSGDKAADRRTHNNNNNMNNNNGRGGAMMSNNWSSMPSMPEAASAYTSNVAAVSTGTPYPMFLLSANGIPETHRLRGFATRRGPAPSFSSSSNAAAAAAALQGGLITKNNNRSANGCEEIPLRWSLLTRQPALTTNNGVSAVQEAVDPHHTTNATANTSTTVSHATGDVNATAAAPTAVVVDAVEADDETITGEVGSATGGAAPRFSAAAAATAGGAATTTSATANGAAAAVSTVGVSSVPHSFASGWTAAELQVHTTHRVMVCTATEISLDAGDGVEDGNAPLVFCCTAQTSA